MLASRGLVYVLRPHCSSELVANELPQILLSFMITALLAIILSTSVIFADFRGKTSTIRRKLLNGYSDSQILQGIGIQSTHAAADIESARNSQLTCPQVSASPR